MRFTGKERKMYVLALGLLVAAIALACTWTMWSRPASQTSQGAQTPTPAPSETPAPEETPLSEETLAPEATLAPEESAAPEETADAERRRRHGGYRGLLSGQLRLPRARAVQGAR